MVFHKMIVYSKEVNFKLLMILRHIKIYLKEMLNHLVNQKYLKNHLKLIHLNIIKKNQ